MGFFKKKNKQITFIENAGGMIITKSIYEGTSRHGVEKKTTAYPCR